MRKSTFLRSFLAAIVAVLFFGATVHAQNVTVTGADATTNAGSPYATLKAAFDNINLTSQTGNSIIIGIAGSTTETAPAVLNAGTWTSISIQPTGGAARTISGAIAAASPLIDLNGADNVTFDGLNTGGNSLTISNTTTSNSSGTCTIRFILDATNNTITNCSILGSSTVVPGTNGGNILFSTAAAGGNDNNLISNCNIGPAGSNLPVKLVTMFGSASPNQNSGNILRNNNFYDFFNAGVSSGVFDITTSINTTIEYNRIYQTATRTQTTTGLSHRPIFINSTSSEGHIVRGNIIGRAVFTSAAASASSSGTTVTLSSGTTDELAIGMRVGVSAGTGAFAANTYVSAINSSTTFTVSAAPTTPLSGATVTGNATTEITNYPASAYNFVFPASTTATTGFFPIFISCTTSGSAVSVQGNTITGIAVSGAQSGTTNSAKFVGIFVNGGLTTIGDVIGNRIGSMTTTGAITVTSSSSSGGDAVGVLIWGTSAITTNNNQIGGITVSNSSTGAANLFGFRSNSSGSGNTWTATGNTVGGSLANSMQTTSTATGTTVVGMLNANSLAASFSNNLVRNLTAAGGTGTAASASVIGVSINASTYNHTISQNTIHTLNNSNSSAATIVTGLFFSSASGTNVVERNLIYGLTSSTTSATAEINGIRVNGGTTTYRNNMIAIGAGVSNALGAVAANSSTAGINGINEPLGTNQFWHNSVYIGGTATAGTGSSFAFNGTQTTNTRSFRNNIFFNARTNSGATGKHYAVKINGTAPNPAGLTINNNVYFANGSGGVVGFFNSLDVATVSAWRTAVGQDVGSIEANPQFNDPTNSIPDLHLHASNPTPAEAQGADLGVTNDYDGQTRSGLTPHDIGADAGDFVAAPTMAYTSSTTEQVTGFAYAGNSNQSIIRVKIVTTGSITPLSLTNLTLNANGTTAIGDIDATTAKVYYTGSSTTFSTGSLFGATTPTIGNFTVTGSQTLVEGNNYFWLAYDVIGAATSGNLIDAECIDLTVGGVQTPTVTAPSGNKSILSTMSGTYAVGASQIQDGTAFTNLTNAIADLTARGVSGAVTFALQNDYSSSGETFPLTINAVTGASGSNTITIKPASGVTATISGSSTTSIFKLNGADYVTIDGSNSGGTTRNLTIANTNTGTSSGVVWVASATASDGATNNTVKNSIITGNATTTTLMGIFQGGTASISTSGSALVNNANNIYQNNLITLSQYGIWVRDVNATTLCTGLQIIQNNIGSISAAYGITGITVQFASAALIEQNELQNASGITTSNSGGILLLDNQGTTISKNKIFNLAYVGSGTGKLIGIHTSSATYNTSGNPSNLVVVNNLIYDLRSSATSTSWNTSGISNGGGYGDKYYFNTVYLTGALSGTGGTGGSACFANGNGLTATNADGLDIRNNIFAMTGSSVAASSLYAHYTTRTTVSAFTISNNVLYAAVTGSATGFTGRFNATNYSTLALWQAATGLESSSLESNPLLNSATIMIPGLSSPVIGAGVHGTGITVDYAGTVRGNPPYIGAYEQNTDGAGPTIAFSALGNTASLTNRTTTSFATITDPSNVNTTGGTKPRLYYKKSTSNNAFVGNTSGDNGWKYVEANNATSPFDFTIDYSILMGGSVAVSDVIQYFVVAADLAGSPNVGISNSLSFVGATPTSVDLQGQGVTSISGTLSSYSILASISGTISVPGTYPSLTLAGGAFEAINNGVVTGNVNIEIAGDLASETGLNALNQFATPFPINIYPTGGVLRTISGSAAGAVIKLNGADNVTIDGLNTGGNALTISNTSTAATTAVIWNASLGPDLGATNNTIKNCTLSNGSSSVLNFGIAVSGTTIGGTGADNDDIVIQANTISACATGIYAIGTATVSSGGLDNLNINSNSITTNTSVASIGIKLGNALNATISQNTLDIQQSSSNAPVGISLETGFNNSTVTKNNVVRSLYTGTGGYGGRGITIGTGSATSAITLSNNVIYGVSGDNHTAFGNSSSIGIAIGIIGNSSTLSTTTGGINLYNNSVNMNGDYSRASAAITTALYVGSGASALDIRNNIFVNSLNNTNGSGGSSKAYAIYSAAANTAFTTLNYNNYFVSGVQGVLGFLTSDRTNLAGIVTGFSGNANSYNANPNFTSNTNLLPVANAFPSNYRLGTTISGVITDYSGTTRSNPPDVGAYEGVDANRWIGTTSTAWATNTNWDNGSVPASNENITIAANNLNNPVLGGDITVNGISIDGTSTVGIGSNTLTVNGAVSGTGTVSGSATSNLTIGGTAGTVNFTSGARIVKNLTLNASATATLGTALDIVAGTTFGTLSVGAGATLTTGGNLTIKSDANGTAQVANSAGSVSGNVTVERYLPAKRAWRLLTAPLGGSNTSFNSSWQNGGSVVANTGVEIWHPSGGTGVTTAGNAANLKTFDVVNNAWVAVTNTQTTNLFTNAGSAANNAFLIFPTGPYNGTGAGNDQSTPAAITTLRATGSLQTGTQTFAIPDAAFSNSEKIQLIGNPYASPVDFNLLSRTNVEKKFWVWDPQLSGLGGYVLVDDTDNDNTYTVTPSSTQTQHLQSGQGFFVEVSATGASLGFNEDDKSASNINTVFRTGTGTEQLRIDMINPADGLVIDGILAQYNNNFSNGVAAEDGQKLFRSNENFYLTRNTKPLMLEGRKLIDDNDTLFLTISGMQQQAYRFAINGSNFANDANLSAYLKDKFLGTETAISLSGNTDYNFSVTADNNSKAADRFMVVFRSTASLPVTLTNVKAYQQNSGINVEWNTQSESGMQQYEVEKSANGTSFTKVNATAAKSGTRNSYNWFDANPTIGANYYRIKAISLNGDVKYSSLVVVKLNSKGSSLTVYPNPIKGNSVQLQLSNVEKGNYSVTLFNQLGQQVMNKTINHIGGSSNQSIALGNIAAGIYELRLSNGTTVITQKLIKE